MVSVQGWAEIRRMQFVQGALDQRDRQAYGTRAQHRPARAALGGASPLWPPRAPSKLEPHREESHRLLRVDPRLLAKRIRELIQEQGDAGGRRSSTYLRELRPLFLPRPCTFQRTVYRPSELLQVLDAPHHAPRSPQGRRLAAPEKLPA